MEIKALIINPDDEMTLRDYIIEYFGNVERVEFDHPNINKFLAALKKDGKKLVLEIDKDNLPGVPFDSAPAIGDRVIVPAWVDGLGKDQPGTITEILKCAGVVSYTVKYDEPNDDGEIYKMVKINHIRKAFEAAPPIPPEYLKQEPVYYEDMINRFCLKSKKGEICYCSTLDECRLLDECIVFNAAQKALNIKSW